MPTRPLTGEGRADGEETDKHLSGPPHFLASLLSKLILVIVSCGPAGVYAQGVAPEQLFHEAQAASRQNDYALAEKLYRQILAADPAVLAARVNLGLACYWQHKSREAIVELQKALQTSRGNLARYCFPDWRTSI